MNIQVYPHRIVLNKTNEVNTGEYNVNECTFEFSQEYEGLTKVAVFSLCDGTTKNVTILNNQCIIPVECLQETGQVQIGVYGYATQDNELVLRYSPTPQNFVVKLGSYKEGTQPVAPTPTDWEILVEQVNDIAEDVSSIHEDITGINGEINGINIDIRDLKDTKANINDLAAVAFTGEFSDLKNIPSYATTQQLNQEIQDRQDADVNLQSQIDAINVSSDVVDVVGTYQELLDYDTQHLKDNDIVKVLQDSTHSNALSYYRWDKETSTWSYVGSEGPFYTKSETDALLNDKQDVIDIDNMLSSDLVDDTNSTNKFVTQADINNWNNKEDKSNKVTEINSSSTDTQYPSAKCVYDSQEEQNEQIAELEMLYNAFPTVSAENETIQLDNTAKVKFREIDLKGNTSQVVIPEEQGTSVSNTSIYVSDVNTDKENTIEMSGNTYQANAILPSEYTQVDYIQSSGSQYIDTGINADTKLRTILDIAFINPTSANQTMGAINIGTPNKRYHLLSGSNSIAFWVNNTNYNIINTASTDRHLWDLNVPEGKVVIDKTTTTTIPTNIDDTELNFWLFGRNSNSTQYKASFKLWACKMYYNGTLVRDFIPCYRNSDNEIGLYDLVNNVFYTNQGTGAFTYGSVASIPNPDYPQNIEVVTGTQNVEVCGKNAFDHSQFVQNEAVNGITASIENGYLKLSGIPNNANDSISKEVYITNIIKNLETSTFNTTLVEGTYPYTFRIYERDENNAIVNRFNGLSKTLTYTENHTYSIRAFVLSNTTLTNIKCKLALQIEKGSTATTYQAYQGTTYPINLGNIELCKIGDYKDRIYYSSGKWYLEKKIGKVVLNGSENWQSYINAYNNLLTFRFNFSDIKSANQIYLLSNYFKNVTDIDVANGEFRNRYNNYYNLEFVYTDITSVTDFKAWLSTHNTTVYYILNTPTTTEITDTTLVNQLNALYNATIYPITNINTDTSNLIPYIDLHYNFVTPSPSPSRPSVVNVVKGNNTITISNSDNTESQNYPINLGTLELCKIGTYQDYIYESNGNWYLKKKIDKKNENSFTEIYIVTSTLANNLYGYACNIQGLSSYSELGATLSNIFAPKILGSQTDKTNPNNVRFNMGIAKHTNTSQLVITIDKKYLNTGTTTEFSNFLNNNDFEYYCVLATPTDTQITDTTLITQLNNIKKAYSYDTQTNISQTNTDKPFIIYAEAIRSLKNLGE